MYRENEMFQWFIIRLGIPIWHLMDEAGTGRRDMHEKMEKDSVSLFKSLLFTI